MKMPKRTWKRIQNLVSGSSVRLSKSTNCIAAYRGNEGRAFMSFHKKDGKMNVLAGNNHFTFEDKSNTKFEWLEIAVLHKHVK